MNIKKSVFFALLLFVVSAMAVVVGTPTATTAYAEDGVSAIETSYVLDDLKAIDGFSITDYPHDESGILQVINFAEYGYGKESDFKLYVYVYNPKELRIDTESAKNKISMSIGDDKDYNKYVLKLCSVSTGGYTNRFYKFKVFGLTDAYKKLNKENRKYSVSEVEFLTASEDLATSYTVATTYFYSGYAKGYAEESKEKSTLVCQTSSLNTISLNVNSTSYKFQNDIRSGTQVSSVYFSVPERYFDYGVLKKVKAEWNEYKTQPIIITENNTLYNALLPFVGVDIGKHNDDVGYKLFDYALVGDLLSKAWGYNCDEDIPDVMTKLAFLFYTGGTDIHDYYLSSELIENYIKEYPSKSDLFRDEIDEERAQAGYNVGYNVVEIDAEDKFDLLSFDTSSWQTKFIAWLFPDLETSDVDSIAPIYEVKSNDLVGTDKLVAKKLLIDEHDVSSFRNYYVAEKVKGNRVFLFRFATSDYSSYSVTYSKDSFLSSGHDGEVAKAEETVFLDFDIIQLSFCKNDTLTVVPVAASPINVVGAVEPPIEDRVTEFFDSLKTDSKKLLKVIAIALAVVIFILVIVLIVKVISLVKNNKKSNGGKTWRK